MNWTTGPRTRLWNCCMQMRLRSTYFSYGGEFYEQKESAATCMDSPISKCDGGQSLHGVFRRADSENSPHQARTVEVVSG